MAEALIKHLGGDGYRVFSAGAQPGSELHPLATEVLKARRIWRGDLQPKGCQAFLLSNSPKLDFVIGVGKRWPEGLPSEWPGKPRVMQWHISEPAHDEKRDPEPACVSENPDRVGGAHQTIRSDFREGSDEAVGSVSLGSAQPNRKLVSEYRRQALTSPILSREPEISEGNSHVRRDHDESVRKLARRVSKKRHNAALKHDSVYLRASRARTNDNPGLGIWQEQPAR